MACVVSFARNDRGYGKNHESFSRGVRFRTFVRVNAVNICSFDVGIVASLVLAFGGLVLGAWGFRRRDLKG
jgi:hypothetical protein